MTDNTNQTKQRKIIAGIGIGGHGPSSILDALTNPEYADYDFHLVFGVDDSGGHTGKFMKVLPRMRVVTNPNLCIPMGDLRANLARFQYKIRATDDHPEFHAAMLDKRHKTLGNEGFGELIDVICRLLKTDMRSVVSHFVRTYLEGLKETDTDFELEHFLKNLGEYLKVNLTEAEIPADFETEIKKAYFVYDKIEFLGECQNFCNAFQLDDMCEGFLGFCDLYYEKFREVFGDELTGHSLGNLYLNFLYIKVEFNEAAFFEILREQNFIPPRVFPHFFYDQRLILKGYNADLGEEFETEGHIDDSPLQITPSSYQLYAPIEDHKVKVGEPEMPIKQEIIDLIRKADALILCTGSFANLFGQLNTLVYELVNYKGLVIWLGNIFKNKNEVSFEIAVLYYFITLNLKAVVLQMDVDTAKEMDRMDVMLDKYRREGKELINIEVMLGVIKKWFGAKGFSEFSNLILPVLGADEASKLAKRMNGKNVITAEDRLELSEALGYMGIKYDSAEISLFIFFLTELNLFIENELGLTTYEVRLSRLGTILKMIKFSEMERTQMHAELNRYRKILSTELSGEMKLQELFHAIENPEAGTEINEATVK